MEDIIRLQDLADLAIGTPENGAVNFTALHSLLHAIIRQLNNQDGSVAPPVGYSRESNMEQRIQQMEKQLEALDSLPSGIQLLEGGKSGSVHDMWQIMQLRRKMEANEEGVSQAMTVLQDLMLEVNALKGSQREIQDQIQKVTETAGPVNLQHLSRADLKTEPDKDTTILQREMDSMKTRLTNLEEKMEVLCESLARRPETKDAQTSYTSDPGDDGTSQTSLHYDTVDLAKTVPDLKEELVSLNKEMKDLRGDSDQMEQLQRAMDPIVTQHIDQRLEETSQIHQQLGSLNASIQDMERELKELQDRKESETVSKQQSLLQLQDQMEQLQKTMDPIVTQHIDQRLEETSQIHQQLGSLNASIQDMERELKELRDRQESETVSKEQSSLQLQNQMEQLQKTMDPIVTQHIDQRLEETSQIHQQLGSLSASIQNMERELKELRDRQEQETVSKEQSSLQLQDQLDTLRGILTTMASSSSTLLAMSIPEQTDSCTLGAKQHLTCPACTIDLGKKVNELVSQFEHLQKLVTDNTTKEAAGKHLEEGGKVPDHHVQDTNITDYIKTTMAQLQEECERLHKTTRCIIEDHEEKQQHIDILYQAVGKLENKKADKELIGLEMDRKSDKRELERKVSRTHHDATTERLSAMIQELLGKVTAQEQDWHRLLEKVNAEMQNKLDRIEIDPLKNILDKRWRDLRRQLQEHPPQYEADEAAGIRKQLRTRFHCISCDRPVNMMAPRPPILSIPRTRGLPAHQSKAPNIALDLNQVREENRRLKTGLYQMRREASQLETSVTHLRRIHAHMRQEIARVQLHFGGSDKTSRKNISHHLQAHCATLGKLSKKSSTNQSPDHLPALGSIGNRTSRSCGGSHTKTSSQRRNSRLQTSDPLEDSIFGEEVLLIGQDGRLYRGMKNEKSTEQALPSIRGTAPPLCSQKSTRKSSGPSRTSQERLISTPRGRVHQQSAKL